MDASAAAGGAAAVRSLRLDAIFCHADVVGASMNESFQAKDGLDPDLFAVASGGGGGGGNDSGNGNGGGGDGIGGGLYAQKVRVGGGGVIPTYTGHYHKPHTVPGTRITYVGSPYQVSRAEAGQSKSLVVLDAEAGWCGWTGGGSAPAAGDAAVDEVGAGAVSSDLALPPSSLLPLDLGPRHFTVKGADADVPPAARAGDIVRWTLPLSAASTSTSANASSSSSSNAKTSGGGGEPGGTVRGVAAAREAGVVVEVSFETVAAPPRIPKAEELGPAGLYDAYVQAAGLSPEVAAEGRKVLAEVAAATAARGGSSSLVEKVCFFVTLMLAPLFNLFPRFLN